MTPAARDRGRVPAVILAAVAVSVSIYAASGRASALGFETSVVSRVAVSDMHYRLNDANPSRIDALTFALRPALSHGTVAVKAGRRVYRCALRRAGTRAVCATTAPPLVARELTALDIVAAQ